MNRFMILLSLSVLSSIGCESEPEQPTEPYNILEDASQSEIDRYNAMIEESNREMEEMEAMRTKEWSQEQEFQAMISEAVSNSGDQEQSPPDAKRPAEASEVDPSESESNDSSL